MAEQQPQIDTINVDDVEYKISELPENAKALLSLYQEAAGKVVEHQRQAAMMDAARRALSDNIIMAIRQWNAQRIKELQAQAAAATPAAQPTAPVVPIKKATKKATVEGTPAVQ